MAAILTAFLTMILCFVGSHQDNGVIQSPHLVEMLQTLCPGANVCSNNHTSKELPGVDEFGRTSCCTECSCLPSCEANGNCCFPKKNRKFDEHNSRKEFDCLFPSSVQPLVEDRYLFNSFLMVSAVLNTSSHDINSTSICGDKKVAPWGSLFPVFSAKRKKIYKNSACAEADSVDDGELWDAEILCKKPPDAIGSDVSLFVLGLDSNSFSDICKVDFRYQGNAKDLHLQKCYLDLVDTCQASDFSIPDEISISKAEVMQSCTSGLFSPYRDTTMYANVFCRICGADFFHTRSKCPYVNDVSARGTTYQGFIALLDTTFITTIQKNIYLKMTKYPEACHIQDTNGFNVGCRRVLCPSGQLHGESGQCRHPSKIWYHQVYQINIELMAEVKLNISDVFQVKPSSFSTTLPDLQIPWGNKWMTASILYTDIDENGSTTKFLVVLKGKFSKVYPDQFLKYIQSTVNRDWLLKYNNVTIPLKSNFSRYTELNDDDIIDIGNYSKKNAKPLYVMLYWSLHDTFGNTHTITKLYMCDQIELTEDDFILSQNKKMLFNKITAQFMFDAEFELVSGKTFDGLRARICINDSGFYRTNRGSIFSFGRLTFTIYCVLFNYFFVLLETIKHVL